MMFHRCKLHCTVRASRRCAKGFTLTELIISIAIAIMLILGVNEVFRASSAAVSGGLTLSATNRDNRVAKSVLQDDLAKFTSSGVLIIRNEHLYAFRNAHDQAGDSDGDPSTLDLPGQVAYHVPPNQISDRNHRMDRLLFFAQGRFPRQTADPLPTGSGPLVSSFVGSEACVWYGHLAVPNNNWISGADTSVGDTTFYNPGDPKSDNNKYASDWVLGRWAIVLAGPTYFPPSSDQEYFRADPAQPWSPLNLTKTSPSRSQVSSGMLYQWPVDIAGTSISTFMVNFSSAVNAVQPDWYNALIGYDSRAGADTRHFGSPYLPSNVAGTPGGRITPMKTDFTAPCLIRGCAHFIVEYAGSYVFQDDDPTSPTYGIVDPTKPPDPIKHKIDFIVDRDSTGANIIGPARVRWYGAPRDTNGDGVIDYHDVLPLYLFRKGQAPAAFEKIGVNDPAAHTATPLPGGDPTAPGFNLVNTPMPPYTCAWNSPADMPKMLRITIGIDDPNGRMNGAQLFEYIINLQ